MNHEDFDRRMDRGCMLVLLALFVLIVIGAAGYFCLDLLIPP